MIVVSHGQLQDMVTKQCRQSTIGLEIGPSQEAVEVGKYTKAAIFLPSIASKQQCVSFWAIDAGSLRQFYLMGI